MPSGVLTNLTCWVTQWQLSLVICKMWNNLVSRRGGRGVTREGVSVEYWPLWETVVLLSCIADKNNENERKRQNFYNWSELQHNQINHSITGQFHQTEHHQTYHHKKYQSQCHCQQNCNHSVVYRPSQTGSCWIGRHVTGREWWWGNDGRMWFQ